MRRSWAWLGVIGLVSGIGGCGNKETPTPPPTPSSASSATGNTASAGSTAEPSSSSEMESSSSGGSSAMGNSIEPASSGSSDHESTPGFGGGNGLLGNAGAPGMGVDLTGGGYPSSMMGGVNGAPPQAGMQPNAGSLLGMLGAGSGLTGTNSRPAPKKLNFEERANYAFEAGNPSRAFDLLLAHSIQGDENAAASVASKFRWNSLAKRPSLGIKIAVGLKLVNERKLTDLKPIGSTDLTYNPNSAPGSGMNNTMEGGMGNGLEMGMANGMGGVNPNAAASSIGAKELTRAAGTLATSFFDEMNKHHSEGEWTVAFQSKKYKGRPTNPIGNGFGGGQFNGMQPGMPMNGENAGNFGGGLLNGPMPAGGGEFRFQNGGGGAVGAMAGRAGRGGLLQQQDGGGGNEQESSMDPPGNQEFNAGNGNFAPMNMNGGMPGSSFGNTPGNTSRPSAPQWVAEDFEIPAGIKPVAPCLDFIGEGEVKKLVESAMSQGYDFLIVFEVEVEGGPRSRFVNNTARVRALTFGAEPKDFKYFSSSKPIVNIQVAKAKQKKDDDGIETAVKAVSNRCAELAKLQPIPEQLKPEIIVNSRLPKLLADKNLSKISKLGEVQFFYTRGYLDETQRLNFFREIVGDSADVLVGNDPAEREEVLNKLLDE